MMLIREKKKMKILLFACVVFLGVSCVAMATGEADALSSSEVNTLTETEAVSPVVFPGISATDEGDVNEDGVVDVFDARMIAQELKGTIDLNDEQTEAADLDGDGTISKGDLSDISGIAAGTKSLTQ